MQSSPGPLLQHLPAIFHTSDDLQQLLSAFEEVLFAPGIDGFDGLEQAIAGIPTLFDPNPREVPLSSAVSRTPQEFLPWLAQWVALSQSEGLAETQLRRLIAEIVPLYAHRGTAGYLKTLLGLFIAEIEVTVHDQELPSLTVGSSRIGFDSRLGGDIAFWFYVELKMQPDAADHDQHGRIEKTARSVIDLAKPAHTTYQLGWGDHPEDQSGG